MWYDQGCFPVFLQKDLLLILLALEHLLIPKYIDSKWVQNSPSDCSLGTLAYTNNPEDYPSQITICPWFLTYSLKTLFPTSKGLRSQLLGQLARFVIPIASRWVYTKIDAYSLFDKLLLHEVNGLHKLLSPQSS